MSRMLLSGVIAAAFALLSASAQAQGRPYSLEQLRIMIQGGLGTPSIMMRVNQNCLAFRLDEAVTRQLRTWGATVELLDGLRAACVRMPEAAQVPPPVRTDTARAPAGDTARARADSARAPQRAADSARAQVRTDSVRPPGRDTARAVVRGDTARHQAPPTAPPGATKLYSPGGVAVKSLILPGLGQFGTGRPALGVVFMAGGAGALALGLMSKRTEIDCLARTDDGTCPSGQVRDEVSEKPMLIPGVAAFVAIGVVSAIEAAAGARRANARATSAIPAGSSAARVQLGPAIVESGGTTAAVSLLRLRF